MGHHHRKHKGKYKGNSTANSPPIENASNNKSNIDLGAMLQNLNLNDVDLSKIDMNKVQSIMDKMNVPQAGKSENNTSDGDNTFNGIINNLNDPRIYILNSIKEALPRKKAKKIERITKLLQMTNAMNNKR
jgi:hypothetical protein